ncbi:hypothetical protein CAEBREN_10165 [Caenorhabditis brenneri]|uniref:Uncharacterized protein n=1 Tax=Caenorhabditis brenneri TaxID=135651 RepID=G0N161_CAEBE|nr:hypothetical protein CAEBREN_10165 [Caenorhabditis brenneri]
MFTKLVRIGDDDDDDVEEIIDLPEIAEEDKKRVAPTECRICFRPAHGHHCGVASCKACKTFFRRICVSDLELYCKWEKKCFEDKAHTRLRCQACRYQKCVQIGMDPTFLELSEEEKKSINFKKLVKRSPDSDEEDVKKVKLLTLIQSKEVMISKKIDMLAYLEIKLEKFRFSAYNPFWREFGSLEEMIKKESQLAWGDRSGPMPGWPFKFEEILVPPLPEKSKMRMLPDEPNEMILQPCPPGIKIWIFFNIITVLEYIKTFEFFNKLEIEDRKILTRHVLVICMNLHNAYFAVSRKTEECLQPDGSVNPLADDHHYPVSQMSFKPLIRLGIQPTEYILLKAICLCNPIVPGLSNHAQDIITAERQVYADILLNHCLKVHVKNGPTRFGELLAVIPVLEQQQRRQKDDYILLISPLVDKLNIFSQLMHDLFFN